MKTTSLLLASLTILAANVVNAASISGQGTWETTLQGRDLDGNLSTVEAYYDTALNITWLANANYGYGSSYDSADGYTTGGMTWNNANAWAANLNINGYTGWRLPTVNPVDGTTANDANNSYIGSEDLGYNVSAPGTLYAGSTASEMAYMFYNTLGDKAYCSPFTSTVNNCSSSQEGWGLTNTGPFSNIQPTFYWSATEFAPITGTAWYFSTGSGDQFDDFKTSSLYAWAVHSGNVGVAVTASTVPVPAAAWLFGSGLLGLIGFAKKRK